uniref:Uncharacterized protein n=1 Tax=Chromera velia CCMP2878 TaxID=1169474 RepID=A0A0G4GIS6_9ALVE|eukprot:Cvel_22078.t1-p1 / transcript=Cvel_22078.t1 / gene=Cvel_22078 / organism=Chromera_velia_CCMP2878 / gene_product=hypothetical protein / transcript_product=hypothetical protein / location=Cvel_scaffold2134:15345-21262(+) / protein_length=957 / sequence_SO=supercontig / SO=protein_coding / is_pseudo=false
MASPFPHTYRRTDKEYRRRLQQSVRLSDYRMKGVRTGQTLSMLPAFERTVKKFHPHLKAEAALPPSEEPLAQKKAKIPNSIIVDPRRRTAIQYFARLQIAGSEKVRKGMMQRIATEPDLREPERDVEVRRRQERDLPGVLHRSLLRVSSSKYNPLPGNPFRPINSQHLLSASESVPALEDKIFDPLSPSMKDPLSPTASIAETLARASDSSPQNLLSEMKVTDKEFLLNAPPPVWNRKSRPSIRVRGLANVAGALSSVAAGAPASGAESGGEETELRIFGSGAPSQGRREKEEPVDIFGGARLIENPKWPHQDPRPLVGGDTVIITRPPLSEAKVVRAQKFFFLDNVLTQQFESEVAELARQHRVHYKKMVVDLVVSKAERRRIREMRAEKLRQEAALGLAHTGPGGAPVGPSSSSGAQLSPQSSPSIQKRTLAPSSSSSSSSAGGLPLPSPSAKGHPEAPAAASPPPQRTEAPASLSPDPGSSTQTLEHLPGSGSSAFEGDKYRGAGPALDSAEGQKAIAEMRERAAREMADLPPLLSHPGDDRDDEIDDHQQLPSSHQIRRRGRRRNKENLASVYHAVPRDFFASSADWGPLSSSSSLTRGTSTFSEFPQGGGNTRGGSNGFASSGRRTNSTKFGFGTGRSGPGKTTGGFGTGNKMNFLSSVSESLPPHSSVSSFGPFFDPSAPHPPHANAHSTKKKKPPPLETQYPDVHVNPRWRPDIRSLKTGKNQRNPPRLIFNGGWLPNEEHPSLLPAEKLAEIEIGPQSSTEADCDKPLASHVDVLHTGNRRLFPLLPAHAYQQAPYALAQSLSCTSIPPSSEDLPPRSQSSLWAEKEKGQGFHKSKKGQRRTTQRPSQGKATRAVQSRDADAHLQGRSVDLETSLSSVSPGRPEHLEGGSRRGSLREGRGAKGVASRQQNATHPGVMQTSGRMGSERGGGMAEGFKSLRTTGARSVPVL